MSLNFVHSHPKELVQLFALDTISDFEPALVLQTEKLKPTQNWTQLQRFLEENNALPGVIYTNSKRYAKWVIRKFLVEGMLDPRNDGKEIRNLRLKEFI